MSFGKSSYLAQFVQKLKGLTGAASKNITRLKETFKSKYLKRRNPQCLKEIHAYIEGEVEIAKLSGLNQVFS